LRLNDLVVFSKVVIDIVYPLTMVLHYFIS